ncbi:MAG: hypothetical protein K0Q67_2285 [Cellvibrio sp.]|jgi:hypothetical protein|nr:hypothetical protein [Cellvibrio sp.]
MRSTIAQGHGNAPVQSARNRPEGTFTESRTIMAAFARGLLARNTFLPTITR